MKAQLEASVNKPFLKWAGGKMKVLPELKKRFPHGKRFIEPFLGAGSVSLNVDYPLFIVNDLNSDLIAVWKLLQTNSTHFIKNCKELFKNKYNSEEEYYKLREEFN